MIDDVFWEGLTSFKDQMQSYGYYDSDNDTDWLAGDIDYEPASFTSEHRWKRIKYERGWVPSRMWDSVCNQSIAYHNGKVNRPKTVRKKR